MITFNQDNKTFSTDKIKSPISSGFGTRFLGDSRNIDNIKKYFLTISPKIESVVLPEQKHTSNISFISKKDNNKLLIKKNTDGLITNIKNIAITVQTGDCVPIIYADTKNMIVGISHQGWKGILGGMPIKMIDKLIESGAEIENIKVVIGPSIGACCYEIKSDVREAYRQKFNGLSEKTISFIKDASYLNLSYISYLLLKKHGIKEENIDHRFFCTSCQKTYFYSNRRDSGESYGQMFSYVVIN